MYSGACHSYRFLARCDILTAKKTISAGWTAVGHTGLCKGDMGMKRRLMAVLLSAAMAFSGTAPVMAEEPVITDGGEISSDGITQENGTQGSSSLLQEDTFAASGAEGGLISDSDITSLENEPSGSLEETGSIEADPEEAAAGATDPEEGDLAGAEESEGEVVSSESEDDSILVDGDELEAEEVQAAMASSSEKPDFTEDGIGYKDLGNHQASVVSYSGTDANLVIPANIKGYAVVSIGDSAFRDCSSLESISIPESVTSLGTVAFWNCASLKTVQGLKNLTSIPSGAFERCSSLTEVILPQNITEIADYAFAYCSALTHISMPGVTSLGMRAFMSCGSLKEMLLPDDMISIGSKEFENCSSLTKISIPKSVTSLDAYAFLHCDSLTDIYYEGTQKQWGKLSDPLQPLQTGNAVIHYNCTGMVDPIENPASPQETSGYIFYTNILWTLSEDGTLTVSDATPTDGSSIVSEVESQKDLVSPFSDAVKSRIKKVVVNSGVKDLGSSGKKWFLNCENLASVEIADTVTNVWRGTFEGCSNLKDVTYHGTEKEWNERVFYADAWQDEPLKSVTMHFDAAEEDDGENQGETSRQIPGDAFTYNGHSYYVYQWTDVETYEEVEKRCESLGGYLAAITSDDENTAVWDHVKTMNTPMCYIGLFDAGHQGSWTWSSKESVSYTNWASGQPKDFSEWGADQPAYYPTDNWARMSSDGKWYGTGGPRVASSCQFLCEWNYAAKSSTGFDIVRDTWGFGNPLANGSIYKAGMFFSNPVSQWLGQFLAYPANGMCNGMALSAAASKNGFPKVSSYDFQPQTLNKVGLNYYSTQTKCTAYELIQYAQIFQECYLGEKIGQGISPLTYSDADSLFNAVKACQEGKGSPVLININGGPGGHTLLGVGIRKPTSFETEIDVYDCNYPGQTGTMFFHKEALGTYSWHYDDLNEDESKRYHWNSGKVSSNLSFPTSEVSDFIQKFDPDYAAAEADVVAGKAEVKRNGPFDSNPTIVYIPDPAPGTFTYNGQTVDPQNDEHTSSSSVQEIDPSGDAGTSSSGSTGKAYWVKGNGGKITFQGLWNSNDAGIEPVTIADNTGSVSVYAVSVHPLSIDLDQKKVTGDLENNSVVVVEFADNSSLLHPKAVKITGLGGGKPVSITQEKNGAITATGLSIVEYESYTKNFDNQSGDVTESDSKHTSTDGLDPSASYRITENPSDRSMTLQEDADHDGKYEKNITNEGFPAAHVHAWDAGTVTKAPTCTNPGVRTYTCTSGDGITRTESIPALGHSFGPWKTTLAPTTGAEGIETRTCSRDGATEQRAIAKLPSPAVSAGQTTVINMPPAATPAEAITIPKKPASVKVRAGSKGKVTVSWKKIKKTKKTKALLKQIKKVQVQYGTSKDTGLKVKTVSGKKTSVKLKLSKKTRWYIRVRYSDGKGGYSNWSGWKKVKTKK